MYNDFLVVGPASDPASVLHSGDVRVALAKIALSKSPFLSRGDDSGTHSREKSLWVEAGIEPLTYFDSSAMIIGLIVGARLGYVLVQPKSSWNFYVEYATDLATDDWPGAAAKSKYRANVSYSMPVGG